jgi:hypothetical protein
MVLYQSFVLEVYHCLGDTMSVRRAHKFINHEKCSAMKHMVIGFRSIKTSGMLVPTTGGQLSRVISECLPSSLGVTQQLSET